jgi:hypothetical protein
MPNRTPRGPRATPPVRHIEPPAYRRLPPNERYRTRIPGAFVQRRVRSGAPLPLPVRLLLGLALVALCGAVVLFGSGLLGGAVSRMGDTIGGFVAGINQFLVVATPTPAATQSVAAPRLIQPTNEFTNKPSVEVRGYAPSNVVGRTGFRIRVYVNDRSMGEIAVAETLDFKVPGVPLDTGLNEITASVVGPDGESPRSPGIVLTYDPEPPPLTITAPRNGATVNGTQVRVTGTTQADAIVSVRSDRTGSVPTETATAEGTFSVEVQLELGTNVLVVAAYDPAGNRRAAKLTITRGTGAPTAKIELSDTRIKLTDLPRELTVGILVTDPNGKLVGDAAVTFGLSLPGLPTSTFEATTVAGSASWTTVIPKGGVVAGSALVTVLVTLPDGSELREAALLEIA